MIPRLLALFEESKLSATWCTVGLVFADNRADAERHFPDKRPAYQDQRLCLYSRDPSISADETLYHAPELIRRIASQPGQEIGTHTFSHYCCLEPGQNEDTFEADLIAAKKIAEKYHISLRSIVFPRNQVNSGYFSVLMRHGIIAYRGSELNWANSPDKRSNQRLWKKRALRLADAYISLTGPNTYSFDEVLEKNGLCNVRASRYLRPYSPSLRAIEKRRLERVIAAMEDAARSKRVFHLWWHPEDMGRNIDENLEHVRVIANAFDRCRRTYGMRSMSMGELADSLRGPCGEANETDTGSIRIALATSVTSSESRTVWNK